MQECIDTYTATQGSQEWIESMSYIEKVNKEIERQTCNSNLQYGTDRRNQQFNPAKATETEIMVIARAI